MFGARTRLGVDIGGKDIKVVQLRKVGRKYEVVQAARVPLRNGNGTENVATALGHFLLETDTYAPSAVCSLPANACSVKFAEVPHAKPTDLVRMVRFEAESQMPLPLDELVWDFVAEGEKTDSSRHIVIAGARRSLIEETLRVMDAAHAHTVGITVSSLAAAKAAACARVDDGSALVVDIGSEWTDMLLVDGGSVYATHSARLGGDELTEAFARDFKLDVEEAERLKRQVGIGLDVRAANEESASKASSVESWVESIGQEIYRFGVSLTINGPGRRPERVILLGGSAGLPGIAGALARHVGLPVEVGDPWEGMLISEACAHTVREPAAAFAVATGLAKAGLDREPAVNLMPRRIAEERVQRRRELTVVAVLGAAATLLLAILLAGAPGLRARYADLENVKAQVKNVRRAIPRNGSTLRAEAVAVKAAVKSIDRADTTPLELLRRLSENLPRGVWLTEFSFEPGKAAVLKGGAVSNSAVADAVDSVNQLGRLDPVTLDYSNLARGEGGQGYEFQITCGLPTVAGVAGKPKASPRARPGAGARTRITVQ